MGLTLLLPVELFGQKDQTSTNKEDFTDVCAKASTISDIFLSGVDRSVHARAYRADWHNPLF
jgi:hypothetical protein